jgi:excinuclease ABC subunit C
MPDLVIVDGGKGQVSAAKEVLDELGLHDLPLAGLAKEREELFLPGRAEPVLLPATSPALYLVQRLRDEAHRFAITYHRDLRARRSVRSAFDDLPGVGPKRKRELLKVFGSIKRVRDAPVEQIAAVPGIGPSLAAKIKATLEA